MLLIVAANGLTRLAGLLLKVARWLDPASDQGDELVAFYFVFDPEPSAPEFVAAGEGVDPNEVAMRAEAVRMARDGL